MKPAALACCAKTPTATARAKVDLFIVSLLSVLIFLLLVLGRTPWIRRRANRVNRSKSGFSLLQDTSTQTLKELPNYF
jgi:hypothetical protein